MKVKAIMLKGGKGLADEAAELDVPLLAWQQYA